MDLDPYNQIHYVRSLFHATEEDLQNIIRTFPIIDNHAHNMLQEELAYGSQEYPFEGITSEAQGHALHDHTQYSLAYVQGINQLAELFRCRPTTNDVKAAKYEWVRRDYPGFIKRCLEGTHAILMDDGFSPEAVYPYGWHRQFVPTVSRIVRIESIAAELLEQLACTAGLMKPGLDANWSKDQSEAVLIRFNTMFRNQIRTLAQDPNVRGFKSVICYRTGLDVGLDSRNVFRPHQSLTESALLSAFHEFLQQAVRTHKYRVQQKQVNDYLVIAVCDVLDKLIDTDGENLPIQFHTGLGDNDIDLIKANPAYMKPLIEAFPNVDFVLLHASYPYTREAGYLATMYSNTWLDIGLVFPMLSRDGQESALRHALQLTPTSKILWSTDGHLHPETYYLANRQFRAALEKVFIEYVQAGDISVSQAITSAVDILFWNSNQLYKLDEERKYPQLARACGRSSRASFRTTTNSSTRVDSYASNDSRSMLSRATTVQVSRSSISRSRIFSRAVQNMTPTLEDNVATFDAFMQANPTMKYIWLNNIDYTGTTRTRMVPVAAFKKHVSTGRYPGITAALPNLLSNDTASPEAGAPAGEFKMVPDLSSLCRNAVIPSPSATVQVWWMEDAPGVPTDHHFACPRWALQKQIEALQTEYGLTMLMGVEIEIIFMRPTYTDNRADYSGFSPLNMVHSWSNLTHQDLDILPIIEEIVERLAEVGIVIDQFHTEAAPGQWEFPLPASNPVKAIDTLYKARDIIRWAAHKHGLKATLYPRPYNFTCGSASHVHFSIQGDHGSVESNEDSFLAGILGNLPSLLAFTLPLDESYARINAGIWAGGEYVCWGTQNREVPLRKCGAGHWEIKTVDGVGNMYLSMAALVASGLHGLRSEVELTCKDNQSDATVMGERKRKELGITTPLPKKLSQSLDSLDKNGVLREMMGDKLITGYVRLKKYEMQFLDGMSEEERKNWLIARY